MTRSADVSGTVEQRTPGVGASLLFGTLVALAVGALPLTRADTQSPISVWAACAGSGALIVGPSLLGARLLRRFKGVMLSALSALVLSAGPLMLLGSLIKTATHHRPLGAMTFAVIAAAVVLGTWAVTWRITRIVEASPSQRVSLTLRVGLWAVMSISFGFAVIAIAQLGAPAVAVILDGTLMLVLIAAALRFGLDSSLGRVPAAVAWSLWALVVVGGIVAAHQLGQDTVLLSLPLGVLVALLST